MRRFSRRAFWLILVLTCVLPATEAAFGQGTSGTLPDPISTRELDGYGRRLDLSPEQRLAIEAFHEEYRESFRALRDSDIDEFLESFQGLRMNFGGSEMGEIDKAIRELDKVMGKIANVDNRFFEQIQTILTEEQVTRLPRVKKARERQRYRSNLIQMVSFTNPSIRIDLSELFEELTLSTQEFELADPLVESYENQLTDSIGDLYEVSTQAMKKMAETMKELGFDPENPNPRQMQRMFEVMRAAWEEMMEDVNKHASEIGDLNRSSTGSITAALSESNGRRLRNNYYRQAYSEVYRGGSADERYEAAIQLEGLPAETLEQITSAHAQFDSSRTRLVSRAADRVDERRRNFSMFSFGDGSWRDWQDEIGEMREEIRAVEDGAIETLRQILGEERMAMVTGGPQELTSQTYESIGTYVVASPGGGSGVTQAVVIGERIGSSISLELGGEARRADPYVPGPISDRDVETYSQVLGLQSDQRDLIGALHVDYQQRFEEVDAQHMEPLRESARSLWSIDGESGQMSGPKAENIDQLYARRAAAREAIERLDDNFFEEIGLVVLGDQQQDLLPRVRMMRARETYAYERPGSFGAFGGPQVMMFTSMASNQEPTVDLTEIVRDLNLSADQLAEVDPVLAEYEHGYTEALQGRFELGMQIQQEMEKMTARVMQREMDDDGNVRVAIRAGNAMRDQTEDNRNKARQADQVLLGLNRSALTDMMALLPETTARELQRQYNHAAFPQVYDDPQSAERQIVQALQIESLTANQRTQLSEIASEFHAEHETLCDQMALIERDSDGSLFDFDERRRMEAEERQQELEKLRFDRTELNEKTRRRLQTVLSEDQARQVSGLGDDAR